MAGREATMPFDSVEDAIRDIREGRLVIVEGLLGRLRGAGGRHPLCDRQAGWGGGGAGWRLAEMDN